MKKAGDFTPLEVKEFSVIPGKGVSGMINNEMIFCGNARLMEENGITFPVYSEIASSGKTPLYFASKQQYYGAIVAADVLKPDSFEAVQELHKQKLDVVILTGDNRKTAEAIGNSAGITHVISDVLPGDKAGTILSLQQQGHKVLMVGDGINDAPALVTADVGMAIGNGTDIAVKSADIVLMNGSLTSVSQAIALSKATLRNIKQNLFWAFFYNCLGIPVAAGVLYPIWGIQLSPMIGAAAMSFSSIFVVTNALRLRFFKSKGRTVADQVEPKGEKIMETIIKVDGMMCTHCKARVESVCKAVAGTQDAVVDLQAKIVTVTGTANMEQLKAAIVEAGYEVVE